MPNEATIENKNSPSRKAGDVSLTKIDQCELYFYVGPFSANLWDHHPGLFMIKSVARLSGRALN